MKSLVEKLQEKFGDDFEVSIQNVTKDNERVETGCCVKPKDGCIAPVIYYDTSLSDDEIIDYVVNHYEKIKPEIEEKLEMEKFVKEVMSSKELLLDKVVPICINRDRNEKLLEACPHVPFVGDIDVMFRIFFNRNMTAKVNNQLMKHLDIDIEELKEHAMKNVEPRITGITDVIGLGGIGADDSKDVVYVVNQTLDGEEIAYGAGALFSDKAMNMIASELDVDDFILLPSSVNEFLALRIPMNMCDAREIRNIVISVNETCLDPEEFLSNEAFVYHKETGIEVLK